MSWKVSIRSHQVSAPCLAVLALCLCGLLTCAAAGDAAQPALPDCSERAADSESAPERSDAHEHEGHVGARLWRAARCSRRPDSVSGAVLPSPLFALTPLLRPPRAG